MKNLGIVAVVFAAFGGLTALDEVQARPDGADAHHESFAKCAMACIDCQLLCDSCFHRCATLVEAGDKEHAKSMHTCVDCADCCALAAKLTARHSAFSASACECCAKCCDESAAACEKFKEDKHMAECARSCRACAKACREMIEHTKH